MRKLEGLGKYEKSPGSLVSETKGRFCEGASALPMLVTKRVCWKPGARSHFGLAPVLECIYLPYLSVRLFLHVTDRFSGRPSPVSTFLPALHPTPVGALFVVRASLLVAQTLSVVSPGLRASRRARAVGGPSVRFWPNRDLFWDA